MKILVLSQHRHMSRDSLSYGRRLSPELFTPAVCKINFLFSKAQTVMLEYNGGQHFISSQTQRENIK